MTTFTETRIKIPMFSPSRVWTIATGTMTQLVRMKTFYFLLVFAVLVAAIGNIDIKSASSVSQLETIKKVSFGTMDIFAWLYAIVATALLIPRDLEDRTLYTILSKPVRRIEYLIGKLLGVLVLIAASLALMFTLCLLMLAYKQSGFIADEIKMLQAAPNVTTAEIEEQVKLIQRQGVRPELAVAALASFLKSSVVAVMTILISTFASSSLFTIITSIFFFLIGHAHGMMTDFWLHKTEGNLIIRMLTKVFKLLIPDFQLFSFSEGIVIGAEVVPRVVWSMGFLTGGYLFVFLLISLMIFLYKEF
ncbi:MAG: ABC transporter permease subunit [Verrucomicrobiales bacterium]|nr:ABC transporter permease subunit [Verrucomicrobiales bacterium]